MPFNPQPSSPASAAGGLDFGGLVSAFAGGGGAGGASAGGSNTLGSSLGAIGGLALGPLGSIAGTALGSVLGSFSSSGPYRAGAAARFEGLHQPGFPLANAADFEDGTAELIQWYASNSSYGVEAIISLWRFLAGRRAPDGTTRGDFNWVKDCYFGAKNSNGLSWLAGDIVEYNNNGGSPRIVPRSGASSANPMPVSVNSYQSFNGNTGIVGPAAMSFGNDPQNPSAPTMRDYLNGIVNGAMQGGGKVFGNTPQGQQMQNDGAKQWLGDNWYLPAAVASVLAVFGYMAFKKK